MRNKSEHKKVLKKKKSPDDGWHAKTSDTTNLEREEVCDAQEEEDTHDARALAFARPGNDFVASNSFWWWWWSDDADVRGDSASSSSAHRADFGSRTSFAQGGRVGIHGGRGPRRGAPPRSSERRRTLGAILDVRRARETTVEIGSRDSRDERKRWNKLDERDEKRESDGGVVRPKPVRRAFFLQLPTGEKKRRQRRRDETRTGRVFLFLSEPVEVEERDDDDDDDDVSRRRRRRVSEEDFRKKGKRRNGGSRRRR